MFRNIIVYLSLFFAVYRVLVINIPIPANFYYAFWAFITIMLLIFSKRILLSKMMLTFLLICFISILANDINPLFQSEYRLLSFCLLIGAIGPLNNSSTSLVYRYRLFRLLTVSIIFLVCLSFLLWFTQIPLFFHSNGLFKGVFNHSMMLSPFAAVSSIVCFQYLLSSSNRKSKLFWFICLSISVVTEMLGASRSALAGMLVGLFVILFFFYRHNVKRFVKILVASISFIIVLYPVWYPYTENLRMKQEATMNVGSLMTSREDLWKDRIYEFAESPLFGSGFAAMNLDVVQTEKFDADSGGVEPGSSWLFLLSSIGIFGFITFVILVFKPIKREFNKANVNNSAWITLISIFSCFCIHMTAEGYILSSGSLLFIYVWLCISLLQRNSVRKLDIHNRKLF